MTGSPWIAGIALLLLFASGCAVTPRYNSLDLALLPCESGDSPVFFRAVEFDGEGSPVHTHQADELIARFERGLPVTDLVLFAHGWNKNPSSAELDYQNFLCRLHGRLRSVIGDEKRRGGLLVLGVFWPSTITNRPEEPLLLKPVSYYRIRDRADTVAEKGVARLLSDLTPIIKRRGTAVGTRLHLIGHSFGGRMVIRSLEILHKDDKLVPLLTATQSANVILINAAVPASRFDWIADAVQAADRGKGPARFTDATSSYLFNLHSFNDDANRYLFPIASLFNDDKAACAAGACGVPSYTTVCVDVSGKVRVNGARTDHAPETGGFNAWNVDITNIVFDHSDIYKGRVATLIADLLYDANLRKSLPPSGDATNGGPSTGGCSSR